MGDLGSTLGWEDPLEEGMATHSSILAWIIPTDRGAWRAIAHGVTKSWLRLSTAHVFIWLYCVLVVAHGVFNLHCGRRVLLVAACGI